MFFHCRGVPKEDGESQNDAPVRIINDFCGGAKVLQDLEDESAFQPPKHTRRLGALVGAAPLAQRARAGSAVAPSELAVAFGGKTGCEAGQPCQDSSSAGAGTCVSCPADSISAAGA